MSRHLMFTPELRLTRPGVRERPAPRLVTHSWLEAGLRSDLSCPMKKFDLRNSLIEGRGTQRFNTACSRESCHYIVTERPSRIRIRTLKPTHTNSFRNFVHLSMTT